MSAKALKHPYAAIEHRVIDSSAYADLTFSARSLLTMITRQLTKNNNGHLQATHSYLRKYSFSENTITRGIGELIGHGMIYRSRSGGFHQGAARYAVTWLPVTNRQGIFLQGFKPCAWRDWLPEEKKSPPPDLRSNSRKDGGRTPSIPIKSAAVPPPTFEDIEYVPIRVADSVPQIEGWMPAYLTQLIELGFVGKQCFQVTPEKSLQ